MHIQKRGIGTGTYDLARDLHNIFPCVKIEYSLLGMHRLLHVKSFMPRSVLWSPKSLQRLEICDCDDANLERKLENLAICHIFTKDRATSFLSGCKQYILRCKYKYYK